MDQGQSPIISWREAIAAWFKIAMLSFGGPAGQIAVMHNVLVEDKKWIDDKRFLHALNFCMLLPGPEAMQLAAYTGWITHGIRGGLIAGLMFILPGIVSVMLLSIFYVSFGNNIYFAGLFLGLKSAVIAIIIHAMQKVMGRALKGRVSYLIAAAAFIALAFLHIPFPIVIISAGILGWIFLGTQQHAETKANIEYKKPIIMALILLSLWLGSMAVIYKFTGVQSIWSEIGSLFSILAMVTFGGAYATLAYVGQVAVMQKSWLLPGEMADGLGMAETTPGPLVMVLQFVGFVAAYRNPGGLDPLLAGILGGLLTSWVTFLPCFLWIFAGAPFVEKLRAHAKLSGALSAITAAVVGVIANLGLWFAVHSLFADVQVINWSVVTFEWPIISSLKWDMAILTILSCYLLLKRHWNMILVIAICVGAGLAVNLASIF
ncbi:chromate transporter [Sphingorhabdus lutea]|uniref:Chromate transporter n=1 Tax=Sphingorhabdus lutea TaxID=1913578 RepID=A0A1L3JCS4_9SPHN|nr:chromate efflux transporter [Sphingorhabdus lutea]APG62912.1 chromate transporter [Sphingorhabdus lutea]